MKNLLIKKTRLLSSALAFVVATSSISVVPVSSVVAFADEIDDEDENENNGIALMETISIRNADDIIEIAGECKNQNFSQGRIFNLENDIDMSMHPNTTIPFMDGLFNGNGHTITGVVLDEDVSDYGFIRFVGQDGCIMNLNVSAEVTGGQDQSHIGIICGSNSGLIEGCSALGSINAQLQVGAIAGENKDTAVIKNCDNHANVEGKYQTGGIAGLNDGIVTDCSNEGEINTNPKIAKRSGDSDGEAVNISLPNAVTGVAADDRANQTGGIAGCSSGRVSYCVNRGIVGYKDLGSETGGIVGHLSGYLVNDSNESTVYGRSFVGGVCGYLEPYEALAYDTDYVQELRDELDDMSDILDSLNNTTDNLSDDLSSNVGVISDQVKDLKNVLRSYADDYDCDFDGTRRRIKEQTDQLRDTIEDMDYNFKLKEISKAQKQLMEDVEAMRDIIDKIATMSEGLGIDDYLRVQAILKQYEEGLKSLNQAILEIAAIMGKVKSSPGLVGNPGGDDDDFVPSEEDPIVGEPIVDEPIADEPIADEPAADEPEDEGSAGDDQDDSDTANDGDDGSQSGEDTPDEGSDGADESPADEESVAYMSHSYFAEPKNEKYEKADAMPSANQISLAKQIAALMQELSEYDKDAQQQIDSISTYLEKWPKETKKVRNDLKDCRSNLSGAYSETNDFLDRIDARTDALKVDARVRTDSIADSMDYTRAKLDLDIDSLISQLRQLKNVTDNVKATVSDGYDEIVDRVDDKSVYVDMSDEVTLEPGDGKIISCTNAGEIYADNRAGGIVGAILEENNTQVLYSMFEEFRSDNDEDDEDDEDDKDDNKSLTKHVQALVYDCVNTSDVYADSGYGGGVVGRADYGMILSCQGFCDVTADEGKYVGGIAGYSNNYICDSYMLGGVRGMAYVGGVAGRGKNILNSYICSYMDMDDEYVKSSGAVAGKAKGSVSGNFFVDNGYGAVDGVTKLGEAEAVSYKELLSLKNLPDEFKTFTVKFIDGDNILWSEQFKYGDELLENEYPKLSKTDGEYAYWEDKQVSPICRNVTVHSVRRVYMPSIQASVKENDSVKPDIIMGGDFYPDCVLSVSSVTDDELSRLTEVKNALSQDISYVVMKAYHYSIDQDEFYGNVDLRVKNTIIPSDTILIVDDDMNAQSGLLKTSTVKSYMSLSTSISSSGYIVAISYVSKRNVVIGIIIAIIALAILIAVILFLRKKRIAWFKKRKEAMAEEYIIEEFDDENQDETSCEDDKDNQDEASDENDGKN